MEKYKFSPTEAHDYEYKTSHPYNLQDHLLMQHNFPLYFYDKDYVSSIYEDRASHWDGFYDKAKEVLPSDFPLKKMWSTWTEGQMMAFLNASYPEENIVGFRLVRFTNVSNGYPTDRLDIFGKHPDTPEMEFGRNIAYNHCPQLKDSENSWYEYEFDGNYCYKRSGW